MGLFGRLFNRESPEDRAARERTELDCKDPRKAFVWGVVAVSYERDPAYLPEHALTAVRDWYSVKNADTILDWKPDDFSTTDSPAYNYYRLCFLARAGYGAGLFDQATSWDLAIRHAAALQPHYPSWTAFGEGYLSGHLNYRRHCGDNEAQIATYEENIRQKLARKQREVWSSIPWGTPMR